jgi:hypothetical protein
VTQGQISTLVDIPQGRLSEWRTGKRKPKGVSTFQKFADGVGLPAAARRALGLDPTAVAPTGASTAADTTHSYPDGAAQATENVAALWRADLADASAFLHGRYDPHAWGDASLRWLVDPGRMPEQKRARGALIGTGDVRRFRATVDMFAEFDNRFGGGHAREALIKYLSVDGDRLLRGRYTDAVGRELFSTVAEATLLGAWMTYDSAPTSGMAQGYFVQALSLARAGGDRLLGGSILDAMSHQATFDGRFTDAANLARAALTGTRGIAPPTLALALARLGDAKSCSRALSESVTEFDRADPADAPAWMQHFNESELSAEFGHCMRDLGRHLTRFGMRIAASRRRSRRSSAATSLSR